MAQDLTVNIKTTSDVPQAMDKAKSATVSFSKQVEDIQKKFSTAFKDFAFAFVAPLVILNTALNYISAEIEKRRQLIAEAAAFAKETEGKFLSSEGKYLTAKAAREAEEKRQKELTALQEVQARAKFLQDDPRGKAILEEENAKLRQAAGPYLASRGGSFNLNMSAEQAAANPRIAEQIFSMINKESKAYEKQLIDEANAKKKEDPVKMPKQGVDDMKAVSVSGNVIGVGANPVLSAIHEQVELAKQQLEYLRMIAAKGDSAGPPPDLTDKGATPATPSSPSRASLLIPKK
jgi:hypothetical protein